MSAWAANRPSPLAATAALILAVLFTGGLLAPWIAPYGLEDMDLMARLVAPFTSSAHILGTDELGRDILTRLLYSLRLSFVLAVCGTLIGAILGTALGFLAARFGGVVDDLVNVGVDFTASLPFIILALTILAFLGTDVKVIIVIMAFYGWDRYAKLSRNLARSAYTEGYAGALEGLGLPTRRILLKHILPNAMGTLIVEGTLTMGKSIILIAGLSFIGMGIQPPAPEWGAMLSEAKNYMLNYPYLMYAPGIAIVLTALSITLIGDGLRDALDPKMKN